MKNDIDFSLIDTQSDSCAQAFNERINEIIKEKAESSPEWFCKIIDIPYAQNNLLTVDLICRIKDKYPSLSLNWLINGEGDMYDYDLSLTLAELRAKIKMQEGAFELMHSTFRKMKIAFQDIQNEKGKSQNGEKIE